LYPTPQASAPVTSRILPHHWTGALVISVPRTIKSVDNHAILDPVQRRNIHGRLNTV
jgi:hypothetical protein